MERTLFQILQAHHFNKEKIAIVVGPRQVGKTTIAKQLLKVRKCEYLYRNWDDLEWRRAISKNPYGFVDEYRRKGQAKPLAVLDEIHKFPRWKRYIKGLWDTRKAAMDILVTGSGRLDMYQRGGDSLLGRYHQYRLHPLTIKEVVEPYCFSEGYKLDDTLQKLINARGKPPRQVLTAFNNLLKWGGFPEPFLEKDEKGLRLWHAERRHLIIKEDLRDISRIQLISHVEELVELLVGRAGSVLSYNSLREDIQVALDSVRLWIRYLTQLYFIYLVRPYSKKISRAIKKEPKLFLWDWSEVEDAGKRFENMVANHLLKWCHFSQDLGYEPLEIHFVRDKEKREVDFLITRNKAPWMLIEAKQSSTTPNAAIHHFANQLGVKHKFLIVANLDEPGISKDVHVIDAPTFLGSLPV